jgi:(p)ppGpp synthase/HD superfamily hydrolase
MPLPRGFVDNLGMRSGSPMLTKRFDEAVLYAIELHRTQVRKATAIPYVTHLFAVCSLVLEDGGTEDEAIAALLHDGPEDQGGEPILAEIRAQFGDDVAETVAGLSDDMPALGAAKAPWRQRKEAYVSHLEEATPSVLKVSLADKLHNARSILVDVRDGGESVWDRFSAARSEQAWYYQTLLAIFERRQPASRNLPELRRVLGELFGH